MVHGVISVVNGEVTGSLSLRVGRPSNLGRTSYNATSVDIDLETTIPKIVKSLNLVLVGDLHCNSKPGSGRGPPSRP
jgi:hypothetical protein